MQPAPNPGILEIDTYVPGKSAVPDGVRLHKLSSNETPLGTPPSARAALAGVADDLARYPDGKASALKTAIAESFGLNAGNILCGNGSDELLGLLCQCYLAPGDEAIHTEHAFLIYRIQILAAGAKPVAVAERAATADVDAILAAVTERTKLVFLANPNNPTGTYLPHDEVRRLRAGLPEGALLVLDAAYAEYVRRNDYESGIELVAGSDNVVMTRTFSKIYGLAGLRIGWLYGPEAVIGVLDRVRGPFNLNAAAIAAGAAAIRDRAFIEEAVAFNSHWLDWASEAVRALGLEVTPSVANFMLIHFPETPGRTAADADAYLSERGYVLRRVTSYGFPNALRMSIGSEEANRGAVAALESFLTESPR